MNTMFPSQLFPSWDAQKGYGTTDFDCIQHAKINYSELQGWPCEFDLRPDVDPICEQVWPFLNEIIAKAAKAITLLLELAGVTDAQKSPFWGKSSF